MKDKRTRTSTGLAGIVAASTAVTRIDPVEGRVFFRGYEIEDLADRSTYEEVIYLLWRGHLPRSEELQNFSEELVSSRTLPKEVVLALESLPRDCDAMNALSFGVAALSIFDERRTTFEGQAASITMKMGTIVAAIARVKMDLRPISPRDDLSYAANFLYMLTGTEPTQADCRIMDMMLVLHADHELTVSTFAARVVSSTLADLYASMGAAIEALKGPLHAGANEQVVRMIDEIGGSENVEGYLRGKFERQEKIPGFGHRIFRAGNHITAIMRTYSEGLASTGEETRRLATLTKIDSTLEREKKLYPNMDFYSGFIFEHLGIPRFLFVPVFAAGRSPGIVAHIQEQLADNRLIRPSAEYVGTGRREYQPISER